MRRVIYLISGPSHLPNLVCSVATLRHWWAGCVEVFVWPESHRWAERICEDERLGVKLIPWEPMNRGRHATYVDKTRLIQSMPAGDSVLFLDADTSISGDIQPLFDMIEKAGFMVAQWCDWTTKGHMTASRIRSLRGLPGMDRDLINELLAKSWPSLNTGVFGAIPTSLVLEAWHQYTVLAQSTFIPDEKTAHLLMPTYVPKGKMIVAGDDGRWNCSPKCQPLSLDTEDVVIWHYHGDSNLRPKKSERACRMWREIYNECFDLNMGGLQDWVHEIPSRHLADLRTKGELR